MRKLSIGFAAGLIGQGLFAASVGAAPCVPPSALASSAEVTGVLDNPASLLDGSPEGGGKLASMVRRLATSDVASLAAIGKALSLANPEQAQSIGAGLGQAATMCRQKNPDVVAQIQETIVAADKRDALASYQAVVQDTLTTATTNDPSLPDPSTLLTEGNPGGGTFRPISSNAMGGADPSRSLSTTGSSVSISGRSTTTTATSPALLSASPAR